MIRIANFNEHYIKGDLSKVQHPNWYMARCHVSRSGAELISELGVEGYGCWGLIQGWAVNQNDGGRLPSIDVLATVIPGCDLKMVTRVIESAIGLGWVVIDDSRTSPGASRTERRGEEGREGEWRVKKNPSVANATKSKPPAESKSPPTSASRIRWDSGWSGILPLDLEGWRLAYPAQDVDGELERMSEWLKSNPGKRYRNYARFITGWFGRADERPRTKSARAGPSNGSGKATGTGRRRTARRQGRY